MTDRRGEVKYSSGNFLTGVELEMAVFTDLRNRVQHPPFDVGACERRLRICTKIAECIHLVHVTGRERPFEVTVLSESQSIPTSADLEYCSDFTRKAEELLELPRSAYFYAGRANVSFGNLAMAFPPDCEVAHQGSVTPFDTGGLVHPKRYLKVKLEPSDDLTERVEYGKSSEIPLGEWREVFGWVLAAYFSNAVDYWHGRPDPFDLERLYELNDDWRAWTFEIRFYESQSILSRSAWCADESIMFLLGEMILDQGPTPPGDDPTMLDRFLMGPSALEPAGSPFFCEHLEGWVRGQIIP